MSWSESWRAHLLSKPAPRRFQLLRIEDASGVSGTGVVAEGIRFRDGFAVYRWLTAPATTQFADSIHDIQRIHGHDYRTVINWLDDEPEDLGEKSVSWPRAERHDSSDDDNPLAKVSDEDIDAEDVPDADLVDASTKYSTDTGAP